MKSKSPEIAQLPLMYESDVPRELRKPRQMLKRFLGRFMLFASEKRKEQAIGHLMRKRAGQISGS